MSNFGADWLALREPADLAARSRRLAERFAASLGPAPALVDLGAGTGANLRYLAPLIARPQHWRCVDHDQGLLRAAQGALRRWAEARGWPLEVAAHGLAIDAPFGRIAVVLRAADLASALDRHLASASAITASALLDLTSAAWLEQLAECASGRSVLMALSVDGRLVWDPPDPADGVIGERFSRHQRRDKGFKPALGGRAAAHFAGVLERAGSRVVTAASDWQLGPAEGRLLQQTLEGIVRAARQIEDDPALAGWTALRQRQCRDEALRLVVGHLDLLALPGGLAAAAGDAMS